MNRARSDRGRPPLTITAHRGFSGAAPENTLAAFRAALTLRCDLIELDVRLSRDRAVVVFHDDTLQRTTDGQGRVSETDLSQLKRLDAGAWFSPAFAGEQIPTLAEVLALARGKIRLNIELKTEQSPRFCPEELADRTWAVVKEAGLLSEVLFSSFATAAIDRVLALDPGLAVALITDRPWRTPAEAGGGRLYPTLNCRAATLTKASVRLAHAAAIAVHAWTVNTPREMHRALSLGVDGIITNHPDRLLKLLGENGEWVSSECRCFMQRD